MGTRGLKVFVGLFVILGTAGVLWGITDLLSGLKSAGWPTRQGKVLESKVETYQTTGHRNKIHETMYTAKVIYEYTVGGRPRQGDRVRFGHVDTSDIVDARRIVAHYPKGQDVTVHYDPDRPERSVLEAGVGPRVWILLGGGLFFIMFPLGFYYAWNKLESLKKPGETNGVTH